MSVKQMALVWEHEFPYNQQLIMLSLADHANDLGEKIFPSIARQAWKTGYSPRQVGRILKELRDANVLVIVKKAYRGRPTEYKIDWSKAMKKEPLRYANLDTLSKEGTPSKDGGGDTQGINSDNKGDTAMSSKPSLKINHQKEEPLNNKFTNDIKIKMVFVLADVTGIDAGIPKNFGRLASDAKDLFKGGYSATDISKAFGPKSAWWKEHWKGKKRQKPSTADVRSSIKELLGKQNKYTEGEFSEFIET